MTEQLQALPIGIQDFETLRQRKKLYVDKTAKLMRLADSVEMCFLSRPRRFGKSLTLSTLEAMFQGRADLFKGLAAEEWVKEQAEHPAPVLHLSMARGRSAKNVDKLDVSLYNDFMIFGTQHKLPMLRKDTEGAVGAFKDVIEGLHDQGGSIVVLIDEYDKPILDNLDDPAKAKDMRDLLHNIYINLKDYGGMIRFLMLTGISKFIKLGVFSALNNLNDISIDKDWGDVIGYTQAELEENFAGWIDSAAQKMNLDRTDYLGLMKDYYDGFCFDGVTKLYNPFSVMQSMQKAELGEYWYASGSPSFIAAYLRQHDIRVPEDYRHIQVGVDFADAQEIENARPESFLYQAGYLTIEKRVENTLTLDYPNKEVLNALSKTYLSSIYKLDGYTPLGDSLWSALHEGDVAQVVELFNTGLKGLAGEFFGKAKPTEAFYNALFLMMLRGAGITCGGEVPNYQGRCDALIIFPRRVVLFEFKLARKENERERLLQEGRAQISQKDYAGASAHTGTAVTTATIVVGAEKRQVVLWG